jgi:CcmD family protein
MKKIFLMFSLLLCSVAAVFGQATNTPEAESIMESNGKINVVVGVVLLIFVGIIGYIIAIDRKLTKLEKELKK